MNKIEQFFYANAGYSYNPKTETVCAGRITGAKALAKAELTAQGEDWYYEWRDDWSIGSHKKEYGKNSSYENREPNTCKSCTLFDADGTILASLHCIDDATHQYRRVVEAELALEAISRLEVSNANL